ncbi:MAG: hypothetical protein WB630_20485 [Candidatus Acidiferrales bacterium]
MKRRFYLIVTCLPLILLVALGIRVWFAWDQERQIPPHLVGLVPFLQETGNIAFSIALGHGFGSPYWQETGPTAWLTPVYPYTVAAAYRIFGIHTPHAFFAIVMLNILCSVATCVPIFYVGKQVAGPGVASGAAWIWAVFPNAVIIPFEWVWDTSLSALLMATILWATLQLAPSAAPATTSDVRNALLTAGTEGLPRWRAWFWYGLLWGFALMTNPSLGMILPFLLGWAGLQRSKLQQSAGGNQREHLRGVTLALGIAVLCCVPWSVRNYLAFHRFVPLRSNLPFELWLGNNQNFDPQSQIVPPPDPERAEIHNYIRMGETAFMRNKWREAIEFMRTHPRLEMTLFARRFVATWTGMEKPIEGFLNTDSLLTRTVLVSNLFAALGALCGIVLLFARRSPFAFPLTVFPAVFPILYYVTHASLRYRHPIDPVLVLLTAVSVAGILNQIDSRLHH